MEQLIAQVNNYLGFFILLFFRVTALMTSSPLFGRKNVPNMARAGFCLILTYVLYSASPDLLRVIEPQTLLEYAVLCIKELLFGLALGYVTTLFFSITHVAGYVIDMHMGFGMVNVMDIQNNVSVPITGNILYTLMTLSFFGVNGHHQLIYILKTTMVSIPIGQVYFSAQIAMAALEVFVLAFVMAVNISIPVIAAGLLSELIVGFVLRVAPQLDMFVLGIPLKIILGLLILILIMPVYVSFTNAVFTQIYASIDKMILGLVRQ